MVHAISWQEVIHLVGKVEKYLRETFDNDFTHIKIVAVERGGLIPGVMLSHRLGISMTTVCIQRYLEGTECVLSSFELNSVAEKECKKLDVRDYIVVDDICDKGVTLDLINRNIPKIKRTINVVLVEKYHTEYASDFTAKQVRSNWWVRFPWEVEP